MDSDGLSFFDVIVSELGVFDHTLYVNGWFSRELDDYTVVGGSGGGTLIGSGMINRQRIIGSPMIHSQW